MTKNFLISFDTSYIHISVFLVIMERYVQDN